MKKASVSHPQVNRSETHSLKVFRDLSKINHKSPVAVSDLKMHPCIVFVFFLFYFFKS